MNVTSVERAALLNVAPSSSAVIEKQTVVMNDLTREVQHINISRSEFGTRAGIPRQNMSKHGLRRVKTRVQIDAVVLEPGWYQIQVAPTDGAAFQWSTGTTSNYRCSKCKKIFTLKSTKAVSSHRTAEGKQHHNISKVDHCRCPDGTNFSDCHCGTQSNITTFFKPQAE